MDVVQQCRCSPMLIFRAWATCVGIGIDCLFVYLFIGMIADFHLDMGARISTGVRDNCVANL